MNDDFLIKKFSGQTETQGNRGQKILLKWQSLDGVVEITSAIEVDSNELVPFVEFSLSEIAEFQKVVENAAQTI